MLTTVVLDVGETLVDETAHWTAWAQHLRVPTFTLFAALGGLVALGQDHRDVVRLVRPDTDFATERPHVPEPPLELYPDALPCLQALRDDGWRTVVGGNQPEAFQRLVEHLALPVDLVTSSGALRAEKPSREFYLRLAEQAGVAPQECVHVGDRADNDLVGAAAAGMTVVHLRRGPWALLHPVHEGHVLDSLSELPAMLRRLRGRNWRPDHEVLQHLPLSAGALMNRTAALTLAALATATVAAPAALAAPKPVTKTYTATAPAPDPTNYGGGAYSVCAQNVPQSFHTEQVKVPTAGTLKVTLSKYQGDWDLLLMNEKKSEIGAGGSSDVGVPEVAQIKLKKPGTVFIVACNWAGGPSGEVTYTFTPATTKK